jgi:sugar lactone lactonase YvrE
MSRQRPRLEVLEDRTVPSALSVTDVTVREGPTATGILDPSGGAAVGLNGPREITFDNAPAGTPGYQHAGDLFVTGYLSHSVARFDWATQTYQSFVAPGSSGLEEARGIAFGPDGNVYVTDLAQNIVFRYDGGTGAPLSAAGQTGAVFIPAGSGGLTGAKGITFGADGNLYVVSYQTKEILRYQGPAGSSPGAFVDVFASDANGPEDLTFGPDGNLYVSVIDNGGQIDRFDGSTGAPIGSGTFVPAGSGGLVQPRQIVFDPTGANMYVVECRSAGRGVQAPGGPMGQVLRFQGPYGQNPGAFVDLYITAGQGGLDRAIGLARDDAGNFYVSDMNTTANVTRFAPDAQASFVVTLDSASTSQISVNYATANGTAAAGTDYTQTSGTLVFPAGVTSEAVNVPITTVLTGGPTKTFTMNLSGASGATISRGQGTGSILNRMTKFFVADGGTSATYAYGSGGTSEEITTETSGDTAPRGVATTAVGNTVWVVDANKNVYVYTNHGLQLGSWVAGGLNPNATLTGIATNGTDIWLVDSYADKVYKYAGAASRLSGSQNAAGNFKLSSTNSNPQDLVTDGTSFWVVDGTKLKVFKYTLPGSLLGSWAIDPADAHPTGITINPSSVSDIWIVDNGTDKVYQYVGAAGRTSGSQNAAVTLALNPYDTNPQGIADPPPPDMLLSGSIGDTEYVVSSNPKIGATTAALTGHIAYDSQAGAQHNTAPPGDTQTLPFKVTGGGPAPAGLPLVPGVSVPHLATGEANYLGHYTGAGTFTLGSLNISPTGQVTGTFHGSFVFVAANGDRLAMTYGDGDSGRFSGQLTADGTAVVNVVFDAFFTPDPVHSTGRFASVVGGGFRMIANAPYVSLLSGVPGFTAPFDYTWSGEGVLVFAKGK